MVTFRVRVGFGVWLKPYTNPNPIPTTIPKTNPNPKTNFKGFDSSKRQLGWWRGGGSPRRFPKGSGIPFFAIAELELNLNPPISVSESGTAELVSHSLDSPNF